jgi:hypothetical protein
MRLPVHLDCEPPLKAGKVEYISIERELPAKSQAVGPLAQLLPEHNFG